MSTRSGITREDLAAMPADIAWYFGCFLVALSLVIGQAIAAAPNIVRLLVAVVLIGAVVRLAFKTGWVRR